MVCMVDEWAVFAVMVPILGGAIGAPVDCWGMITRAVGPAVVDVVARVMGEDVIIEFPHCN